MSELILSPPGPGESRQVSAEGVASLVFDFGPDEVILDATGADLVIEFDNGGQIVIQGVLEQDQERLPELHIPDGIVLSMGDLLRNMFHDPEPGPVLPEAGPGLLSRGDGFIDGLPGGAGGAAGPLPDAAGEPLPGLAALGQIGGAALADDELQRLYAVLHLNADKL